MTIQPLLSKILGPVLTLIILTSPSAEAKSKKHPLINTLSKIVNTALVQPPRDLEVCFSPEEPCAIKLTKFIESAQKSLDIAIYDITLDQLAHQIILKSKKIPVRIIADRRQAKGNHSLVPLLIKAGVNLRLGHQRGIFHNKFSIVDSINLETGSFNYTNHASTSNNENQIYLSNPTILNRYKDRFEKLWYAADPAQKLDQQQSSKR
jgi:phosphatidylserine/phosphatidylglycerophosphate/cardiolipin synthase-like enzyme